MRPCAYGIGMGAVGLGLPFKHITVNLAPADLPKEGSALQGQPLDYKTFLLVRASFVSTK